MVSEMDRFIDTWLFDVQRRLECALEEAADHFRDCGEAAEVYEAEKVAAPCKPSPPRSEEETDDLFDGDEATQAEVAEKAAEKIAIISALVSPPPSAEERHVMAVAVLREESLTAAEKITQVDAILHPKRKRGRPRTETVQQAIRAKSMHLAGLEWRVIAFELLDCKHFDAKPAEKKAAMIAVLPSLKLFAA
jgi:hypothetical protein